MAYSSDTVMAVALPISTERPARDRTEPQPGYCMRRQSHRSSTLIGGRHTPLSLLAKRLGMQRPFRGALQRVARRA